jgi:ribokinase/sulfofructose kinase
VLFDLAGTAPAAADWPPEESIRGSRALLLDHYGMEGMLRAARIARSAGIPIVADFEAHQRPEFAELAACVDHLIVSLAFASAATGMDDPAAVCRALWSDCRQAVVVTCGAAGCWYLAARQRRPEHLPAFRVAAIDTTGCGDTFRGVYAAALAAGMSLTERLQRAAAAAAIVASCPFEDATTRFPDRCQIEAFLAQRAA